MKKRVLIIANEISPYVELTGFSNIMNQLAVKSLEKGYEVRVIMPKFGVINDRRHRLHEVVRLSGININVDKEDYPLLIKVASLPNARLQVYFMDNEDFFRRRFLFEDEDKNFFKDNAERMLFFTKSSIEIVKKFGWPPDIVHCHGWMTSMLPNLLKKTFTKEPVFAQSKVIYTAQPEEYAGELHGEFSQKIKNSLNLDTDDIKKYNKGEHLSLTKVGCEYADIVVSGDKKMSKVATKANKNNLVVDYDDLWSEDVSTLFEIYDQVLEEVQ